MQFVQACGEMQVAQLEGQFWVLASVRVAIIMKRREASFGDSISYI